MIVPFDQHPREHYNGVSWCRLVQYPYKMPNVMTINQVIHARVHIVAETLYESVLVATIFGFRDEIIAS